MRKRLAGLGIDCSIESACRRGLLGVVVGGAAVLFSASSVAAEVIPVSTKADSGPGSLREAIEEANDEGSFPGPDTINIKAKGTINLASSLPELTTDMTIVGPGASLLTVARAPGAPNFRVFGVTVSGATVSIKRLAVKNGSLDAPSSFGGGIFNGGTLTLTSVLVAGNSVADDSGIAQGGGISNTSTGTLTIRNSRVTRNEVEADGAGSGIRAEGTLNLVRSTVDRNIGSAAIFTGSGSSSATIQNSTIANNQGIGLIGAVVSPLTVTSSTIAANDGSPQFPSNVHIAATGTTAQFGNTIVADPPAAGFNCTTFQTPTITSDGFNLSSDSNCPFDQPSDRTNKDPKLGALKKNGGPTPTMAIPKSSPATDRGGSGGLTTDQRGKHRPVNLPGISNASGGDGADIGAFEIQKP
jgi:hypothetical protein